MFIATRSFALGAEHGRRPCCHAVGAASLRKGDAAGRSGLRAPFEREGDEAGGAGDRRRGFLDSAVCRLMRDGKLMEIEAGTGEIRPMRIGRHRMKATTP